LHHFKVDQSALLLLQNLKGVKKNMSKSQSTLASAQEGEACKLWEPELNSLREVKTFLGGALEQPLGLLLCRVVKLV